MLKRQCLILWLLVCCASFSSASMAGTQLASSVSTSIAASPSRIQASYELLKAGVTGAIINETYTRTKDRYRIESVTRAVGLLALFKPETITVISEGVVTAKGLRPHMFTTKRELDSERNSSAELDWNAGRVTLNDRNGKRAAPLPAGTQDRLSAMYQFMFLPLKNTALDFYMTNGSKVDIYNYEVTPGQSVKVPLGTFPALYVASTPKEGESRTEIWVASEHINFPYKMTITDPDGGKLTQVLTRFELTP